MRQLHVLHDTADQLAVEVVSRQLQLGDEVRVVLTAAAAATAVPEGAEVVAMPALEYDQLVELIAWSERVVSW